MSKIALSGNASGTGVFTFASPNSNTDRTLDIPDASGTVILSSSNIESQVKTATNATGSAPIYACRAWVNFNGTSTVAIRASGNVSSITDNGTGDYTVNFTTAMPDANYCAVATANNEGSGNRLFASQNGSILASSWRVANFNEGGSLVDSNFVHVAIFR